MPMMFNPQENQQETQPQERRYDPDTLRKVTALATRLQHDHHERLTASQMEAIGVEVGLKPEFVQQALAQVEEDHARQEQERLRQEEEAKRRQGQIAEQRRAHEQMLLHKTALRSELSSGKAEFYSTCAAVAIPFLFGLLAWHFKSAQWMGGLVTDGYSHPVNVARPGMLTGFTLLAPVPMSLLLGFLAGKKRVAALGAAAMIFALAPTFPFLYETVESYSHVLRNLLDYIGLMFGYVLLWLPIVLGFSMAGAWARNTYFPFNGKAREEGLDRPVQHREYVGARPAMTPPLTPMQAQAYGAQQAHAAQPHLQTQNLQTQHLQIQYRQPPMQTPSVSGREHRAYLSLDVAEKDVLRQSATLVAVDYSFGQFRSWVDETVRGCGGELQSGGSLVASFATDAQAVKAARLLQERLLQFNQTLNRLPVPFRLRAAISAGEAGTNVAADRSVALLRAADPGDTLVSSEVGAAALAELGQLTPLPASLMGDMTFVWRPNG